MKPRIGLNCDIKHSGRLRSRIAVTYHELVSRHGATPLVIPPGVAPQEVAPILDGVVLIGGFDYRCGLIEGEAEPERFVAVHPQREQADLLWANFLLKSDLPVFAICGGFQLLNIVSGGTIYGDLESEVESTIAHRAKQPGEELPVHEISWFGGLPAVPEPGLYQVNSSHHQSIKELAPGWQLLAQSKDGIIEAAHAMECRIVGVQWHPEEAPEEPLGNKLFQGFIHSCRDLAARRI